MINYTMPMDYKVAELRGVTLTDGRLCRVDGRCTGEPDAVEYYVRVSGQRTRLLVGIAGKPELEAVLAAKRAGAERLAAMGWAEYEAAQDAVIDARSAYDAASERGYPQREAAAMASAEAALEAVQAQYPQAALYAKAQCYSLAANAAKATAGTRAMEAIRGGADPAAAIEAMDAEWSAYATAAVNAA